MAYAQWVYMLIHNKMKSGNLMVKRSACTWCVCFHFPPTQHAIPSPSQPTYPLIANSVFPSSIGESSTNTTTKTKR